MGAGFYQSHPWVPDVRRDGSAFGELFDSAWRAEPGTGTTLTFRSDGPPVPMIVIDRASPPGYMRNTP